MSQLSNANNGQVQVYGQNGNNDVRPKKHRKGGSEQMSQHDDTQSGHGT
jgi:hypothetical protein